jgi:hypothetical protein
MRRTTLLVLALGCASAACGERVSAADLRGIWRLDADALRQASTSEGAASSLLGSISGALLSDLAAQADLGLDLGENGSFRLTRGDGSTGGVLATLLPVATGGRWTLAGEEVRLWAPLQDPGVAGAEPKARLRYADGALVWPLAVAGRAEPLHLVWRKRRPA